MILAFCNQLRIIAPGTVIAVEWTMPAYLIAHVRIHDVEAYKDYAGRTPAVITAFGGRVLARGPAAEPLREPFTGARRRGRPAARSR